MNVITETYAPVRTYNLTDDEQGAERVARALVAAGHVPAWVTATSLTGRIDTLAVGIEYATLLDPVAERAYATA